MEKAMTAQVIGISGSPIKNSNTDRMVQHILKSTGLETEFIKLSKRKVQPCIACLGCAHDNICKVKDDFQEIAEKVKNAKALVIGGYPPYASLDSFTKAFLERLYSLRHRYAYNKGKPVVTVVTGNGRGTPGIDIASEQLKTALSHEGMDVIGQIKVEGNIKCTFCGHIETCSMGALDRIFGGDINNAPSGYCRVEDQTDTWQQGQELGREIATRLKSTTTNQ